MQLYVYKAKCHAALGWMKNENPKNATPFGIMLTTLLRSCLEQVRTDLPVKCGAAASAEFVLQKIFREHQAKRAAILRTFSPWAVESPAPGSARAISVAALFNIGPMQKSAKESEWVRDVCWLISVAALSGGPILGRNTNHSTWPATLIIPAAAPPPPDREWSQHKSASASAGPGQLNWKRIMTSISDEPFKNCSREAAFRTQEEERGSASSNRVMGPLEAWARNLIWFLIGIVGYQSNRGNYPSRFGRSIDLRPRVHSINNLISALGNLKTALRELQKLLRQKLKHLLMWNLVVFDCFFN